MPKSDLLRSEVELSNARQILIKATNDYASYMVQLENVMGKKAEELDI